MERLHREVTVVKFKIELFYNYYNKRVATDKGGDPNGAFWGKRR